MDIILTHQQQTNFDNIEGKGEIACNEQFLLFPQCFLLNQILVSPVVHFFFYIISLYADELEEPKIGIWGKGLKSLKKPWQKTLCEKEKILLTSIFSFSHEVFYPIKDRDHHLSYILVIVWKCPEADELDQTTKFQTCPNSKSHGQTDRQTDWFQYNPENIRFAGGCL